MTVTTSFFSNLTDTTSDLHHQTLHHPMVQAIGSGALSEEIFRYYIEQDYLFLLRYVQVIALGSAASDDLETTLTLVGIVHSTIDVEIDALRQLYRRFGGEPARLDSLEPSPTCDAYTKHLLAAAHQHDTLLTMAAILPCQWGYREIGRSLKRAGLPDNGRYAAWIEEYASDEYAMLVDRLLECFNRLAIGYGPVHLNLAEEAFRLSSRYEYAFWDMAWNQETWQAV